jgi:hypothetical protein
MNITDMLEKFGKTATFNVDPSYSQEHFDTVRL